MLQFITDRTQQNVSYLASLAEKGWHGMTESERAEWLGNPLDTVGANLIPYGPYYSSSVDLKYTSDAITATATAGGVYLYAVSIVGEASLYENKTFTLSVDHIAVVGGGLPQITAYWHDDGGFEYAGASLLDGGSVTFNTADFPNVNRRGYLALYVYVTTSTTVEAGAFARFCRVMLEIGNVRHTYVPYTEVVPTMATKGAYNYSDLNRVERAVAELSDSLDMGLSTKTNWTAWDVPVSTEMERFLGNVAFVKNHCVTRVEASLIPESMAALTYEGANDIEKVLQTAECIRATVPRSGDLFCSEV